MIETKRLLLRQCTMDDMDAYLCFWNDPEVMKHIGDGTWGGGEEVVKEVLSKNLSFYDSNPGFGFWGVCEKSSGNVIGEAGLVPIEESNEIEAGYLLARRYWGQGFGEEILRGLLEYGFSSLGLSEIIAVAHPDNAASIHLMKKCGLVYVGQATYHNRLSVKYVKHNLSLTN